MIQKASLLALGAGLALSGLAVGRVATTPERRPEWPEAGVRPSSGPRAYPPGFAHYRVMIDAGHGAPGNSGNRSAFCREEQDFTLDLAEGLKARLDQSGHFEASVSRRRGELVPYAKRVQDAEAWNADVLVSLHSDVRGKSERWEPLPGRSCLRSREAPGFSVLWSDEGEPERVGPRHALARAVSIELGSAGFLPYSGHDYGEDYAADETLGVFADRHAENERVFVLWRPAMPSVLIETHNALDDREALRWEEPETREAFARAVERALIRVLAP